MALSFVFLLEDIKDEMKLNENITKLLSEAKTNFSGDEYEVRHSICSYSEVPVCNWTSSSTSCNIRVFCLVV